jgi:hypothetical protein
MPLIGLLALLIALAAAAGVAIGSLQCGLRWNESGMANKYSVLANTCFVEARPGVWIPEERYRETP